MKSHPTSGHTHPTASDEHFDLEKYIAQKETKENMARLARALAAEWSSDAEATPDLSFDKFEEKRKAAGDQ